MQRLFPTSKGSVTPTDIYDDVEFPKGRGRRPYIALNMVSTVDGKTTLDEGRMKGPIGSPVDRHLMSRLRLAVDAVMRGAATVRNSPYYPGVPEELVHLRINRGMERQPLVIVITATGDLPLDAPIFQEAPRRPLVIVPEDLDESRAEALRSVADVISVGRNGVDLPAAMNRLFEQHGITRILSEGGPRLNYECVQADLLDELFWTIAPKITGNQADLTLVHGPALLHPVQNLQLISVFADNSELYLRYKTVR